ncbi:MAG: hypothetical protein Q8P80_05070 [Candidatus Levybacteria bacterium]|nr:hypothetical protein [Candidatus Levybacteria bacterium]
MEENLNQTNQPVSEKSSDKADVVALWLVFFQPVGVFLMWKWMKGWKKSIKILITIPLAITLLGLLAGIFIGMMGYNSIKKLESAKIKITPSPLVHSPTPTSTTDLTANWKTYENTKFGYKFSYPPGYFLSNAGTDKITKEEASVLVNLNQMGAPGFPVFYINVLAKSGPPTNINYNANGFTANAYQYLSTKIEEIVSPPNQAWNESFKRLEDVTINDNDWRAFEGYPYGKKVEKGLKDKRLVMERGNFVYIIGTYYVSGEKDEKIFNQILQTFHFAK